MDTAEEVKGEGKEERKTWQAPDPALLSGVLSAREARWQKRIKLAQTAPSLVSLTLCLPLPFRTGDEGKQFLKNAAACLEEKLRQEGLGPDTAEVLDGEDGLALFIPCKADAETLKRFCIREEETLPGGRLLDMDVTGQGGRTVGRSELGLLPRKCFLCGRPAAECVAGARHTPDEVAAFAEKALRDLAGEKQ